MRIVASFIFLLVAGVSVFTLSHDALSAPDQGGTGTNESEDRFHAGLCAENPSWCNNNAGLKNNNPGNIRTTGSNWVGEYSPCPSSAFECWELPELGMRAAYRLQLTYEGDGLRSITERISKWAPPSENDTGGYITFVSESMGHDPNTPFSIKDEKLGPAFIRAMTDKEVGWKDGINGNPFYSDQQVLNGFELAFDFDENDEQGIKARALEMANGQPGKYTGEVTSNPTSGKTGATNNGYVPGGAGDPIQPYNPTNEPLVGNDNVYQPSGSNGGDTVTGGSGNDTVTGGSGDDTVTGGGDDGNNEGDGGSDNDENSGGNVDGGGDNGSKGATACEETSLFNADCSPKVTIDDHNETVTFTDDDEETTYSIEDGGTFTNTETNETLTWDELVERVGLSDDEADILKKTIDEGVDLTPPVLVFAAPTEGEPPLTVHFNAFKCSEGFAANEDGEILLKLEFGDGTREDAVCNTVADDFENATATYSFSTSHRYREDGTYEAQLRNIATNDIFGTASIIVGDGIGTGNTNFNDVVDPDDIDGDGIKNKDDRDVDGDGIPNSEDDDIDGDGVPNKYDDDIDGDGVGNSVDKDVDGDGVRNRSDDDIDGDGIPNEDDTDENGNGVNDADERSAAADIIDEVLNFASNSDGSDSGSSNPLGSLGDIGSFLGQMLGGSGGLGDMLGGGLGNLLGGNQGGSSGGSTGGASPTGGPVSGTTGGTAGGNTCGTYTKDSLQALPNASSISEAELYALMTKSDSLDLKPLFQALKGGFKPAALQKENLRELGGTGEPLLVTSSDFSINGVVIPFSTGEGDLVAELTSFQLPSTDTIDAIKVAKEKQTTFTASTPTDPVSVSQLNRKACVGDATSCPLEYGQMKTIYYNNGTLGIYGGMYADGSQVQPAYSKHGKCYIDYSQGLRLITPASKESASDVQEGAITKPLEQ